MTEAYEQLRQRAEQGWQALHERPWVSVSTGILGHAAGALATVEAFRRELAAQGVEATLSEGGTTGLCYAEPLVDISVPCSPRVLYANVGRD